LLQSIQLQRPRLAIHDQKLANADAGIEFEFLSARILGTYNFNGEIRAPQPELVAIPRFSVFKKNSHVGTPVVLYPVILAVADIYSCPHIPKSLPADHKFKNRIQLRLNC